MVSCPAHGHLRAAVVLRRHRRARARHSGEGVELPEPGSTETVVFDKTGTLTDGTFSVTELVCAPGVSKAELADIAAAAETFSTHPIAQSVRAYRGAATAAERVCDVREVSGQGVEAVVDGREVLVGNGKPIAAHHIAFTAVEAPGTVLYVAADGTYLGAIVIADTVKPGAARAIADLRAAGVKKTVMLTGDRAPVAQAVAAELGIDEVHAELLPRQGGRGGALLAQTERDTNGKGKLAFVGDGINDAPVLTRADIGIAMGAMGSDAAIEAADIVLMNDDPADIARAIHLARRTMGIVWQNIVFALGIKFAVLVLAAFGIANMWMAVFADVGVAVIAILNAMRAMNVKRYLD
ncbi:MAG: HAD-IC family P-type ATPase [Adlercreutzia sp.]